MPTNKETKSHAAFHELLDVLRSVADDWLGPDRDVDRELDIVEGLRNTLHLLSAATDFYLEGDAERPEFVRIVSPIRRLMGDNPDAIYHFARVRDDRAYRIRGSRGDAAYVSFTLHGRSEDGRLGAAAEPVLSELNDRGFEVDVDGRFEVILSADERPGNWIELKPGASSLLTRHYFELEGTPAAEPQRHVDVVIEAIDDPGPRPLLDDATLASRLEDVAAFVRGGTLDGLEMPNPPPFVSTTPNELGQPMVFAMAGTDAWGAVDIAYSMGPFELEEGEALVMEGRFPPCEFANVVLWNKYLQTFEYRDRQVSLNRKQTVTEPDGSFRIVVSATDPGVPNWLDTEGRRDGTIFWRFLLPEETPEKPVCRVVNVSELREGT
jgi:hypothetical protein